MQGAAQQVAADGEPSTSHATLPTNTPAALPSMAVKSGPAKTFEEVTADTRPMSAPHIMAMPCSATFAPCVLMVLVAKLTCLTAYAGSC